MASIKHITISPKYPQLKEFMQNLPSLWELGEGKVIYKGRNELREFEVKGVTMVIKSFQKPNFINQLAYGIFRPSKAKRSYEYAHMILKKGIGTPEPIGYYTERK